MIASFFFLLFVLRSFFPQIYIHTHTATMLVVALLTVFMSVYRLSVPFQCLTHCVLSSTRNRRNTVVWTVSCTNSVSFFRGDFFFVFYFINAEMVCEFVPQERRNWKLELFNFYQQRLFMQMPFNSGTHYRLAQRKKNLLLRHHTFIAIQKGNGKSSERFDFMCAFGRGRAHALLT